MERLMLISLRRTLLVVFLAVAAFALSHQPSVAQESTTAVASAVQNLLAEGAKLEEGKRWSEAIRHYESALRTHPQQSELVQRIELARVHLDLGRRYHDRSFIESLAQMTPNESSSLYADILLKIQSHYVHSPDWQDLVRRGILNLDVALTESVFLNHHFQQVDLVAIDRFRRSLRELYRTHPANDYRRASEVANLIAETAKRDLGLNHSTVMAEFTSGAAGGLDTYSAYLTGHQLSEVFSQIEGNFVGLGVELKTEDHRLHIVNVIPGGPAAEGGVRGGQTILAVDGQAVAQISPDAAADMLKGEEGSSVTLTLGNPNGQAQQVRLVRKRVDVPSVVDVSILDQENGIGYLRVTSFQKTTTRDIDNALWDLHRQGMRSLIFDVRGNPGGLLTASVEIADKFISTGTIVSTRGRSSAEDYDYRAHSVGTWRVPLIVLIDGDSASASEIFAGAIRDHQRGQVIGQRSYGKGSVQGIFPMDRYHVGVRLTTAKFYSPSGQPISDRGVTPTIAVPVQQLTAKPNDAGQLVAATTHDAVLRTGLQVARDQLSRR